MQKQKELRQGWGSREGWLGKSGEVGLGELGHWGKASVSGWGGEGRERACTRDGLVLFKSGGGTQLVQQVANSPQETLGDLLRCPPKPLESYFPCKVLGVLVLLFPKL